MQKLRRWLSCALVFVLVVSGTVWVQSTEAQAAESFKKVIKVTAKKYGAKSGKDSTKAIQKALDDAGKLAKKGGKRVQVVIPKGTYYIDHTLRISSNTYLKCEKGAKLKKKSKNCLFMIRGNNSGKVGSYKDLSNITIDGGYWDAGFIKRNKDSGGTVMYFVHCNNLTIKNATLCNVYGACHLTEIGASNKVTISNCEFYGFKGSESSGDKEAIQLDISHNDDIEPDAAPYDDTACTNVVIEKNKIHNFPRGIGSHSGVEGVLHKNITIRNNKLYNLTAEALYLCNYYNTKITKNDIKNVGSGIVVKGFNPEIETMFTKRKKGAIVTKLNNHNYKIEITGNKVTTKNKNIASDTGQVGVYITANEKYPVNGSIVKNNTLKTSSTGIVLKYASNSQVTGNKITRLNNSKVKNYSADAIGIVSSSGNKIQSNKANTSKKNKFDSGIGIRDKSVNNIVIGNKLSYFKENGIKMAGGSSAEISNNTISNTGSDGMAFYDNSKAANVSGNTISSSGRHGIFVNKGASLEMTGTSKKLTITNSKQHGMAVSDNAKVILTQADISKSGKYGVFGFNSAVITIQKGNIRDSSDSGVWSNGATVNLKNTTISNSGKYGVAITNKSNGSLTSCTIQNSKSTGVYISKSKAGTITSNQILNNAGRGMDITGSTITDITKNKFCNPRAGIQLRVYNSTVPKGIENLYKPGESDSFGNYVTQN